MPGPDLLPVTRDLAPDAAWRAWRGRAFPFFALKTPLNHAAVSPFPAAVRDAVADYAREASERGQSELARRDVYDECKRRAAQLIGHDAQPDEIAFCSNTSHALGVVATSIAWQAGDNCVVVDGDFPANVVTWRNLERTHGVEVRLVPTRPPVDVTPEEILARLDERTRLVSVSTCNFLSGRLLRLRPLSAALRERGVLLCVDAIQTLGAIRLDALPDFVCADAHKWLLGPNGIALLRVRREVLPQLHPMMLGWLATRQRDHNWFDYTPEPHPTAERFEPGARNMLGIFGLNAALELLLDAGPEAVEARVTALRNYATARLQSLGCRLLWTPEANLPGGVVTFQPPQESAADCHQRLLEHFDISLRKDRDGAEWIRVSPHFMNDAGDLDALAEAVAVY